MTGDIAVIDADLAVELLDKVVRRHGPHIVYANPDDSTRFCLYVHGNEPGCIVGHALALHGVPIDVMRDWDNLDARADMADIYTIAERLDYITDDAACVFDAAQKVQDRAMYGTYRFGEKNWAAALNAAKTRRDDINTARKAAA